MVKELTLVLKINHHTVTGGGLEQSDMKADKRVGK